MFFSGRFVILFAFFACSTAISQAEDVYTIDNAHTSLVFSVSHFNISYSYGRFNKVAGEFTISKGLADSFRFSIDAASIDTNEEERDQHLRGPDFFDAQQFPEITFESTRIERANGSFNVVGNLTMLGETRQITIPVRPVGIGTGPFGKERAGFFATFTVKRSEFGMDKMMQTVGNSVRITFSFEGVKKTSDP
jgi:polyisoprenoid-binding protein YceI